MTEQTRYYLRVDLSIERQENAGGMANPDGSPVDPNNPPYWTDRRNERLSVREELNLGGMDFMGVMKVLSEMHDAISAISPNKTEGTNGEQRGTTPAISGQDSGATSGETESNPA